MSNQYEQIIVGAGFAGICMAIKLREAGMTDFVILERNDNIGGTWYDNVYPGAACDVESHLYSYSFEPNPDWSRQFSPQEEILQYMEHCVKKYDIDKHIRLNTEVTKAVYNESTASWHITTANGENYIAHELVTCSGGLSEPSYPAIKGLDSYKGKLFHSARWDKTCDLTNKKVAIIGSGASAIQIVPAIIAQVRELDLYQRTPSWVIQKSDKQISSFRKTMYKHFPFMRSLYRFRLYWTHEMMAIGFVVNPKVMKLGGKLLISHMHKSIKDPELRKKLTPNYVLGCKRILLSNDYYPALAQPNAHVITEGIKTITESGVQTNDGMDRPADAIVLATGFQASEGVLRFEVKGKNGVDLNESWRDGAEAYLGTAVAGFPNMFIVVGPNTGLGHSSMILMIEAQVHYIMECLKAMKKQGARSVAVKQSVQKAYNDNLQKELSHSVWQSGGCHSWYQTKSGKNVTLWPGFTFTFMKKTKTFEKREYEWG